MKIQIKDLNDVKQFAHHLIAVEKIAIHPDEDFNSYVNIESNEPLFSKDEAALRNKLMQESFNICEKENESIYDIMSEIFLKETGLDKFIPLPSEKTI